MSTAVPSSGHGPGLQGGQGEHSGHNVLAEVERIDAIARVVALQHGERIALVARPDGQPEVRITYRELEERIARAAASLTALGVAKDERVMLIGENTVDMIVLLFAACRAGAWAVPLNARLSAGEIDAIRAHCEPRLTYFGSGSAEAAAHALRLCGERLDVCGLEEGWVVKRAQLSEAALQDAPEEDGRTTDPADQVAVMIYTSGSTGTPKGVMLTHRNLCFIANTSAAIGAQRPDDRIYLVLPISHSYGLTSVMLCGLRAAATLYPVARFSAEALVRAVREDGLTVFQGVPAMYARLVEWGALSGQSLVPNQLRLAYIGGSMIDPARKSAAETLLGLKLHHGYGLTEAAPTVTRTLGEAPPTDTTIGWPFTGIEVCLLTPEGSRIGLEEGATGELLVRGPNIMKGYYRDPEETRRALDGEGWLHTGDQANVGSRGELYIVGRLKELIIRGGFNVFPPEVENAINAFDGVAQCAVVGVAEKGDETVVAFIEPMAGQRVDPERLRAFLRERLAPYKIPSHFEFRERLPASGTGKLLKAVIRKAAQERLAATGSAPGAAGATATPAPADGKPGPGALR